MNNNLSTKPIPKPTIKQLKYVKRLVETGNGTQAALDSYNVKSLKTAQTISTENLQKPAVQNELKKALIKAGLTNDSTSDALHEIMDQGIKSNTAKASDAIQVIKLYHQIEGNLAKTGVKQTAEWQLSGKGKFDLIKLRKQYSSIFQE